MGAQGLIVVTHSHTGERVSHVTARTHGRQAEGMFAHGVGTLGVRMLAKVAFLVAFLVGFILLDVVLGTERLEPCIMLTHAGHARHAEPVWRHRDSLPFIPPDRVRRDDDGAEGVFKALTLCQIGSVVIHSGI